MDVEKMTPFARKNYEAIKNVDVPSVVASGRKAVADGDLALAASFAAGLAYPALAVYENKRKSAWSAARNYLKYGKTFDEAVHFIVKLKGVAEALSAYLEPEKYKEAKNG